MLVFERLVLYALLAVRTYAPSHFHGVVTAYMNNLIGKKLHYLIRNFVYEFKRAVLTGAQNVVLNAPARRHIPLLPEAGELRVRSYCRHRMPWHVKFRNNLYKALAAILYNIAYLLLGIISFAVICFSVATAAVRALLRKHRIFIDFNAPALVIGKMPMKNIQLVKCHKVYKTFYLACPPKTAA